MIRIKIIDVWRYIKIKFSNVYKLPLCNICELSNLCSLVEGLYHYIPSSLAFSLLHVCDPKAIDCLLFSVKSSSGEHGEWDERDDYSVQVQVIRHRARGGKLCKQTLTKINILNTFDFYHLYPSVLWGQNRAIYISHKDLLCIDSDLRKKEKLLSRKHNMILRKHITLNKTSTVSEYVRNILA